MTKKHFEKIAQTIKWELGKWPEDSQAEDALTNIANELAAEFKGVNPRFDRGRFLAACGVG